MFFGWGLLRVSGQSMGSIIKDGDYALTKLVSTRDKLNTGDVLQVDHPNFGMIVKFVRKTKNEPMTIGWVHRSKVISRLLIKISGNGMSSIKRCSQG